MSRLSGSFFNGLSGRLLKAVLVTAGAAAAIVLFRCGEGPSSAGRPLPINVTGDTAITVHDTLALRVSVPEAASRGVRYIWFVDSSARCDTVGDSVLVRVFTLADTGAHIVVVRAVDRNGVLSRSDTVHVNIGYDRPAVTLYGETTCATGAPYSFGIAAVPGSSPLDRYSWFLDDPQKAKLTIDTVMTWVWKTADTGTHLIVARAIDRDGIWSFPCSLRVTVTCARPALRPLSDTAVTVNDTLLLRFELTDPSVRIVEFRYFIDDPGKTMTTAHSTAAVFWRAADTGLHRVVVAAVSADSVFSTPDTSTVLVCYVRPSVALEAPADVSIHDTVSFVVHAGDTDGGIAYYRWSVGGDGTRWFTTAENVLPWVFGGNTEEYYTVRVAAVNNDGIASPVDSVRLRVTLKRPVVRLAVRDTAIYANTSFVQRAAAFDSNGTIVRYRWTVDGSLRQQSLLHDTITVRWSAAEAGKHLVVCTVVDDDSLESTPDSMRVTVLPGTPIVTAMRDTTVSSLDSLRLTCAAADPNGTIAKYYWSLGSYAWDDSTAVPYRTLRYAGQKIVRVLVGARDNDGLIATDTIMVTYNRPQDSITVRRPGLFDTLLFTYSTPACTVSFDFNAADPDGDTVTYSLLWGPSPDSLAPAYQGTSGSVRMPVAHPGVWYWRIVTQDSWGHTKTVSRSTAAIKQYRICFIGHSVVAGMGGNDSAGGFRGPVMDSLRKSLRAAERLKAVGPATTPHMACSAADDSCMAVSATTAKNLSLFFTNSSKLLGADIWVLMTGFNGTFNAEEFTYTNTLIDCMYWRNPEARIYVLNSPPSPSDMLFYWHNYYLPSFNQNLADSVAAKKARGVRISLVDAWTSLSNAGVYDSTWFVDGVHPTQRGYDRLGSLIYDAMKTSNPPAFFRNPW